SGAFDVNAQGLFTKNMNAARKEVGGYLGMGDRWSADDHGVQVNRFRHAFVGVEAGAFQSFRHVARGLGPQVGNGDEGRSAVTGKSLSVGLPNVARAHQPDL